MLDKTHKQLKLIYWSCVIIMFIAFVLDVLYTSKYTLPTENTGLERWGIIITLGGIFASLKLLHPRLNESDKTDTETALRKYFTKYIIRLTALVSVSVFNLICLNLTGIENFRYLAFLSVFALFLCAPNKAHIESETEI
ncbi:hypothetical protein CLV62_10918 [Dysgonomonas alginatilytica]|uniref:Uncharacterized protein n=1 Tax=Dysgonomonas alginatilytica TaxID=1605892 RepID=A0A2V3PP99_9BACT|nr:hypothetical protein [Dysgonomonas alginatilytica]PXV64692.1 hypothetical protein CLV62_10918 [Dysgonomonas alginatilytica]